MSRSNRSPWLLSFSDFSIMAIFLLLPLVAVKAQGYGDRTGGGGENKNQSIQGHINFPSNEPAAALRVRLESPSSATLTTFSNSEGIFYFSNLYPGQYSVIVETGDKYEPIRESLSIERELVSTSSRTYTLMVDLREKGTLKTRPGVLNASLAKVPKSALDQFKKALEAMDKGDGKQAIEKLNEAIELYPQFAEAYSELGTLYLKDGEIDKAGQAIQKTLQLNENNPTAQLNYGIVLLNQRKMYEAEKQLERVVLADDKVPTPHMYLGIALVGLNYPDYAEKEFLKAVNLKDDERVAQAHKYLGGIYWKKGNYKQAVGELEKYVELAPKASDAEKVRATIKQLQEKVK